MNYINFFLYNRIENKYAKHMLADKTQNLTIILLYEHYEHCNR